MKKRTSIRVILPVALFTCVVIPISRADNSSTQKAAKIDVPKELANYHDRLLEIQKDLRVSGIAVSVVKDNKVIYVDAVGERDPEKHLPVTPDSIFYIASITKTFVGTAIISLINEGKIELDAPVKRYLPRFELADAKATESITIRDLLTHSKGIDSDPVVWLDAYTGEITEDRYYRWLREVTPKGSHQYTNVHYTLLGRVIESVTGQPWKDFLDERLFQPMGMTRTTCYASEMYGDANSGIPTIRAGDGFEAAKIRKNDSVMHAAGGMGTTVNDLARWIRMNLNGGKIDDTTILPKKWIDEMHKLHASGGRSRIPSWVPRTREGNGIAWMVGTYRDNVFIEHGGGYVGTAASVSFLPEKNMGIAVVSNSDGACAQLVTMDIYDRLLGADAEDLLPRFKGFIDQRLARTQSQSKQRKPNPAETDGLSLPAKSYVGRYEHKDWGTIQIRYADGKLVGNQGNLTLDFESTGMDSFRMSYGTGEPDNGRFDIDEGRRVTAAIITLNEEPVRFERK